MASGSTMLNGGAAQQVDPTAETAELRQALDALRKRLTDMTTCVDAFARREKELRAQLLDAHEQLLSHDEELRRLAQDLLQQREALEQERDFLRQHRDELAARIIQLRDSFPGRVYRALRNVLTLGRG